MTRLTRKTTNEDYKEASEYFGDLDVSDKKEWIKDNPYQWTEEARTTNAVIQKMVMLEDLEEELGCPLDVVFKALMNGFYICNGKDYIHIKECLGYHTKLKKWYWLNTSCEISDYGISWWTKKPKEEDND